MHGSVYRCIFAHLATDAVFRPSKTLPNSFVKTNLPVTLLGTRICLQNPRNSMKTRNFRGEGEGGAQRPEFPFRDALPHSFRKDFGLS